MPNFMTDFGWAGAEIARQGTMSYIAVLNTRAAIAIAEKKRVIAQGYLDLSTELRMIWKDVYLENERQLTYDLFNEPEPVAEYSLWAGRATPIVAGQFAERRRYISAYVPKFCTGDMQQRLIELEVAEATARGDATMYGMRFADAKQLALDDRLYQRRHAAIGLGRGLGIQAQSYAQAASGLYGQLGQQAAAGASGALSALGYFNTRKQPNGATQAYDTNTVPYVQKTYDTPQRMSTEGLGMGDSTWADEGTGFGGRGSTGTSNEARDNFGNLGFNAGYGNSNDVQNNPLISHETPATVAAATSPLQGPQDGYDYDEEIALSTQGI